MPAASRGTFWGRAFRQLPFLFKRCPAGLLHPRYDQVCYCRLNEHVVGLERVAWHGGIYDFRSGQEILTHCLKEN